MQEVQQAVEEQLDIRYLNVVYVLFVRE